MRIKSIGCQYFNRFGEWNEIHFPEDKKIIGIVGRYHGNPNKSNRAGKSSFVEMILYALFGKGRVRSESDMINFNYNKDMLVRLVLDDNGKEIVIDRGRNIDSSSVFNVTGLEGLNKTDVQNELNKILGIDYKDFIMTYFFVQDDIHAFMQSSSSAKKEYIIKWIHKDYWKELEEAAKERLNKIQESIKNNEYFLSVTEKVDIGKLEDELKSLEDEKINLENQVKELTKKRDKLSKKLKSVNFENLEEELEELKKEIKRLEEKIKIKKRRLMPCKYKTADIFPGRGLNDLKEINDAINKKTEELYELKFKKNVIESQIREINSKLAKIEKFKGICPFTEKSCSSIDSSSLKAELEKQLEELDEKLNSIDVKAKEKEIINLKEIEKFFNNSMIEQEIREIQMEIDKKQNRVEEIENIINNEKYLELQEKLEKYEKEIKKLQNKVIEVNSKILAKKQLIETAKEQNEKIEITKRQITNLKKLESYWKFITYMFGKNGIPSIIVNESLQVVEDETNIILEKLGAPIRIEFTNLKQLKSWEERCLVCGKLFESREMICSKCGSKREKKTKDELILKIYEGDKETDFDQDSGGGKVLISVAIRLALMRMLIRTSNSKIRFIVLDEIFGMLDKVYRRAMLDLIRDFVVNELQIDQVFIISHTDISDLIDDVIVITRYEKYSTFGWLEGLDES